VNSVFNSASSFSGAVGSDLQIEPNDCDFSCILEYRPGQKELIHSNFCGQNTKIISLNIVVNKNKELNFNERNLYCELVEKARLEECSLQIEAIRTGLEYVIPIGLLKLLSWK